MRSPSHTLVSSGLEQNLRMTYSHSISIIVPKINLVVAHRRCQCVLIVWVASPGCVYFENRDVLKTE